jgi:putative Ca2+/H+ antiporter (TMEM165/GDT1 family)
VQTLVFKVYKSLFYGLLIATSAIIAEVVIYQGELVQRVYQGQSLPTYWWIILGLPTAITIVGIAASGVVREKVLATSLVAAISYTLFLVFAGWIRLPGHLKSLAVESPFWFCIVAPALLSFVLATTIGFVQSLFQSRTKV